ncbi:hypothetical protein [Ktedonospora formicarum]|uniref:Uncharacterized protein n=1 Tax=Ktedonospora formicarum TaxID=2778364 RepID=A0A8J3MX73_9CHLR|nr:hypothetical protein [Ktedonospora formicarum]GHO49691.1 hypothetical protein KSX_78540 [Ktedonospora formicarum]
MKTASSLLHSNQGRANVRPWFEWSIAFFSTWFVLGLYLDGWAHANELPDSFFTPWHAFLYSGFLGAAIILVGSFLRARLRGASLRQALPVGYNLSLLGVGLFLLGGVGDMLWHIFFGIEANLEALYSPTHLLLAASGFLLVTGGLRSAWWHVTTTRGASFLVVLSLTLALSILTFFTSEFHPFDHPWAWVGYRPAATPFVASLTTHSTPALLDAGGTSQDIAEVVGVSSILLQSALLMALLLLTIRRFGTRLPFGWLTFLLGVNGLGMSIFHSTPWVIPVAGIAGLIADALYRWLGPTSPRIVQLRLFAAVVPIILYSLYFLAVFLIGGVWWSIHLWTGGIALAGVVGWFMSLLLVPPATPEPQAEPRPQEDA